MDYSIIVPVFNEEANIFSLYDRLLKILTTLTDSYEIIFINDGSKDNSLLLLKELASSNKTVKYINLSRNFGHQIAVSAGIDHCTGERVIIIDADLQDPPELIIQMAIEMDKGFDVVYAKRKKRKKETFLKLLTAKLFYKLLTSITNVSIPVDTGDFRMVSKRIIGVLKQMPETNKFLRGQISWIGFNQTYVEYDRDERFGGKTGYTYKKMIRLALDGITSFSDLPLKMATFLGFLVSTFTFIMIVYVLYSKFVLNDAIQGWASLMLSIVFLGGVQLLSLGIIGEYISRIFNNVRNRPLYVIEGSNIENQNHAI